MIWYRTLVVDGLVNIIDETPKLILEDVPYVIAKSFTKAMRDAPWYSDFMERTLDAIYGRKSDA